MIDERSRKCPLTKPQGIENRPAIPTKKPPKSRVGDFGGFNEWRGQDSNLRPRGYEPRELPGCSTPRHVSLGLYGPQACSSRGRVAIEEKYRLLRAVRPRPASQTVRSSQTSRSFTLLLAAASRDGYTFHRSGAAEEAGFPNDGERPFRRTEVRARSPPGH